jgi:DNA-binding response OmpR family regulator
MKSNRRKVARSHRQTILIVDDNDAVREMVGRVIADEGYDVRLAPDGDMALEIVASNSIDLVLLDLNLPGQNGWDVFEQLTRENPFLAVIIITARPNQLFTSLAAGVGALLEKPLDYPTLLKTVADLLAESPEARLARMTGHHAGLHYLPATGVSS